jgi:hypothetical protein
MIIVKLQGGLGNQMFQYAFGYYLADKHKSELKLDLTFLLDRSNKGNHTFRDFDLNIFDINISIAKAYEIAELKSRSENLLINNILNKLKGFKKSYVIEPGYQFYPEIFESGDNVYLEGYWQTEKYFKPISNVIKKIFTVKENLTVSSEILSSNILSENAVCVNIRRGDFINNPITGTLTPEYYLQAEKLIIENVDHPKLYIFSDDLEWCYKNLKFKSTATFVSDEYSGYKYQDKFRLMSMCKHFIIPNSSFAWWATYLAESNHNKLVIAPAHWVQHPILQNPDIYIEDWRII